MYFSAGRVSSVFDNCGLKLVSSNLILESGLFSISIFSSVCLLESISSNMLKYSSIFESRTVDELCFELEMQQNRRERILFKFLGFA